MLPGGAGTTKAPCNKQKDCINVANCQGAIKGSLADSYLGNVLAFANDLLLDEGAHTNAGRLQGRSAVVPLLAALRLGILLEVAAMETHVPIQGGYVLELAMTEIALDGLLDLHNVQQMRIEGRHQLLAQLLILLFDLIAANAATDGANQLGAILHSHCDVLCIVELRSMQRIS